MISKIKEDAINEKVPIIKDGALLFILDLIKKNLSIKNILELGTAVGYSAINFAFVRDNIHIETIEKDINRYNQAIINIEKSNLSDRIKAYNLDIDDFNTNNKYDLIFVDGPKAQYKKHFEKFINNLNDGGYMIFDNMIFHGLIYEIETIRSRNVKSLVKKIISFRYFLKSITNFDIIFYDDIGDGIVVLRKYGR